MPQKADRIATNLTQQTTGRRWRFEYLGEATLIIEGTVSGAVYRFKEYGQVLEVACEDSRMLSAMPQLRAI